MNWDDGWQMKISVILIRKNQTPVWSGGNSECEPRDPIPNSTVKTLCADDTMPAKHGKVGRRQVKQGFCFFDEPLL